MSTATLNAPQANQSNGSRRRGLSTPLSMKVPSNQAAQSTPENLDYVAVAREVMHVATKNAVGTTRLVSNKSKQHVFALICASVRSRLGLPKTIEVDGVVKPHQHTDAVVAKIRAAMEDVWKTELLGFLTFGGSVETSNIRITKNAPVTSVILPEKSTVKNAAGQSIHDLNVALKLQAVVTRAPANTQEAIFVATMGKERAEKRLATMQSQPGRYDREDIREQQNVITVHEWKLAQLRDLKALEERQAAAVAALDAQKALGQVTEEQYAEARRVIESNVQPAPAQGPALLA